MVTILYIITYYSLYKYLSLRFLRINNRCWSNSILELWDFNETKIMQLSTVEEVITKINRTRVSPVTSLPFVPTHWLGDVRFDSSRIITGARAARLLYVIKADEASEYDTKRLVCLFTKLL